MEKLIRFSALAIVMASMIPIFSSCEEDTPADPGTPAAVYDYELVESFFTGTYYGTIFSGNGTYNYFIVLSDLPAGDDGSMVEGASYYQFDTFGPAPADAGNPAPPVGTYTLGAEYSTENMTFAGGVASAVYLTLEDGSGYSAVLTEGTLDISIDGGNYVLDARLVDENGKSHHVAYTGPALCEDYSGSELSYGILENDLTVTAAYGVASYLADADGLMEVSMQFTDMPVDGDGYVTPPGTIVFVDAIMPFDADGNIAPVKYNVSGSMEESTLYPGKVEDFFGYPYPSGTYVQYIDESGAEYYGAVASGSMIVSGSSGNCTVEYDFTTEEGCSVTGSYTGPLSVYGVPGPFSTLTGDYTLDLASAAGTAIYFGDYYGTGGSNWMIQLLPSDGMTGDGLQADLVTATTDMGSGIKSGTYKVSATGVPEPGEYIEGSIDNGYLSGTMYFGGFTEDGVTECAPATGGDLVVAQNGDGTYSLSFSFADDLGHTWDGEWSGALELSDMTDPGAGAFSACAEKPSGSRYMVSGRSLYRAAPSGEKSRSGEKKPLKVSRPAVKTVKTVKMAGIGR